MSCGLRPCRMWNGRVFVDKVAFCRQTIPGLSAVAVRVSAGVVRGAAGVVRGSAVAVRVSAVTVRGAAVAVRGSAGEHAIIGARCSGNCAEV